MLVASHEKKKSELSLRDTNMVNVRYISSQFDMNKKR